ncbi:roadblock/LC7 domain-containing protein [Streptomonospora nanhaiensis]|uniref:roadblock/LC7 domain-containing protein n=1 Tax=Streptomonospora nanhaiensis TaxID=1323731 RepID=UPI0027E2A6BF|nr:roadblock/LC7 domain-containing protein [Streptomonospora nanhaiensis]
MRSSHRPAASASPDDVDWLLQRFTGETSGVEHAVLVSSDGVCMATSRGLDNERAGDLAAIVSGLQGVAEAVGGLFDLGDTEQVLILMARGRLVIRAISDGSRLAVITTARADLKVVAFQMARVADGVGHALTPAVRRELLSSATDSANT